MHIQLRYTMKPKSETKPRTGTLTDKAVIETTTRRHHLTREEEADRSLNHTTFGRGTVVLTVALFLLTVFAVPAMQHVVEIRENVAKGERDVRPEIYRIGKLLPTQEQLDKAGGFSGYWNLIPTTEAIVAFEDELKESSVLTRALLSPAQEIMAAHFGVGNEKAYVGLDGWLYYRPDVDYLTSAGFLEANVLRNRRHAQAEVQPDPIRAILHTRDQLRARGIELVLMPVPTKPMIHPEGLIGKGAADLRLQNPSYGAFLARLEKENVAVFDPTDMLRTADATTPQYLKTDTHWTAASMDAVAAQLAETVQSQADLTYDAGKQPYSEEAQITAYGDILQMLKLPAGQKVFAKETVTTQPVRGFSDEMKRSAQVLLLGDSFANIYSLEGMGWGTDAGLAERLSQHLGQPVDKIVINAGGAFSSRQDLQAQLKRGNDRLAGKKVVVWEFCMRDLSQGDWKILDLPKPKETSDVGSPEAVQGMTVTGRIAARTQPPAPGSVPYKDCVISLQIADAKSSDGTALGKNILVYVWGMKDNALVDGTYAVGQTVTLKLTPWGEAEPKYGGYNRMEIDDPASFEWDAFWGEKSK
jgi:alginate O-acetyltransferase complex protein AlgJ